MVSGSIPTHHDWKTRCQAARAVFARLLAVAVGTAIALLVLRTWFVEGLIVPLRIVGGSMADTLYGAHRRVTCTTCGYRWRCDATRRLPDRIACPICGSACRNVRDLPLVGGDRVLVEKLVYRMRSPRRWELVAFRRGGPAGTLAVKRVVGLPGEQVEIRGGDVYIDGRVARKTLAQQKAMALPLFPVGPVNRSEAALAGRWGSENARSGWTVTGGTFAYRRPAGTNRIEWLWYEHRQPPTGEKALGHKPQARPTPVTNTRPYNAGWPQRAEHCFTVCDLMLSLRVDELSESGTLALAIGDGKQQFCVFLTAADPSFEVFSTGPAPELAPRRQLGRGVLPRRLSGALVDVSLFDRQLLLAIDGRPLFAWELPSPAPTGHRCTRVLGIGADLGHAVLGQVAVFRDVYYFYYHSAHCTAGKPIRLRASQYYVLGDNPLLSDDSRSWPPQNGVTESTIIGKPFVALSYLVLRWGKHDFQVPNLATLRYIR